MTYLANQDRRLLFLDSETTGLDPLHNEAIEWAGILTEPDGTTVIRTFEAKVKPVYPERFDARAKEVNGYTEDAWADAPDSKETARALADIAADTILVGQNVSFDENFLKAFLKNHDMKPTWHYHKIDTMNMAWPLIKSGAIEGLSLVHLAKWAGVEQVNPHRAMSDAQCVKDVYAALMRRYETL